MSKLNRLKKLFYSQKKMRVRIFWICAGFLLLHSLMVYGMKSLHFPGPFMMALGFVLIPLAYCEPLWVTLSLFSYQLAYSLFTVLRTKTGTDLNEALYSLILFSIINIVLFWVIRHYMILVVKSRQEHRELDRSKTIFLANMSHELRTPLTGIIGFSHLLKERLADSYETRLINIIHDSGQQLLRIVNDILDYSSIQEGQLKLQYATLDLRPFFRNLTDRHKLDAQKKGLEFYQEIGDDVPHRFSTDQTRFQQILDNLLTNAIKFTSEGSVTLSARIQNRNILQINITDTGYGLTMEQKTRVFEQFYQADSSSKKQIQGKGLGLAISLELARLMDGDITVESEAGQGCRFILKLPLRTTD